MTNESPEILYAAHTATCTFLLDADGVCRKVTIDPNNKRRDVSRTASRCVGAQYVASLDGGVPGCLVEMPRKGAALLFARVDERGRVTLVRSGIVTGFETRRREDPFKNTREVQAQEEAEAVSTSAPEVAPRPSAAPPPRAPAPAPERMSERSMLERASLPRASVPTPRASSAADVRSAQGAAEPKIRPRSKSIPDPYADVTGRTQPIQPIQPAVDHDDIDDLKTAEYNSHAHSPSVPPARPAPPPAMANHTRTLRTPKVALLQGEGESDGDSEYTDPAGPPVVRPGASTPPPKRVNRLPRPSEVVQNRWSADRLAGTRRRDR